MLELWNRAGPPVPARAAAVLATFAIEAGRAHAVQPCAAGSIVARYPVAPTVEHASTLADGAPEECAAYPRPCGEADTRQAALAAHVVCAVLTSGSGAAAGSIAVGAAGADAAGADAAGADAGVAPRAAAEEDRGGDPALRAPPPVGVASGLCGDLTSCSISSHTSAVSRRPEASSRPGASRSSVLGRACTARLLSGVGRGEAAGDSWARDSPLVPGGS
eukprot:scaffold125336_cov69-Phaeocystis_antarctica.AAC.1